MKQTDAAVMAKALSWIAKHGSEESAKVAKEALAVTDFSSIQDIPYVPAQGFGEPNSGSSFSSFGDNLFIKDEAKEALLAGKWKPVSYGEWLLMMTVLR